MVPSHIKPYGLVREYAAEEPMTPEESHARHDADNIALRRNRLRRTYAATLAAVGLFAAVKAAPGIINEAANSVSNVVKDALHTGNETFQSELPDKEAITFTGFIERGAHVRTDPRVIGEDLGNNTCDIATDTLTISGIRATITESRGDGNGRWLGFNLTELPASTQAGCANDIDGLVWVTEGNTLSSNP